MDYDYMEEWENLSNWIQQFYLSSRRWTLGICGAQNREAVHPSDTVTLNKPFGNNGAIKSLSLLQACTVSVCVCV